MRYAVFSDVHANLQAWNAVQQDMRECGVDVAVCLGDMIGYGPRPEEVLAEIRRATPNVVLGNHDAAAAGLLESSVFNQEARGALEWTKEQLSADSLEYLRELPLSIESGEIFFTHAEIEEPGRFKYIRTAKQARAHLAKSRHLVTFIGHTHEPKMFVRDRNANIKELPDSDYRLNPGFRYIVNVGSVGEPRNPQDLRARYVIYDDEAREVYFRRIDFDVEGCRRDLEESGLAVCPYFLQIFDSGVAAGTAMSGQAMIEPEPDGESE